VEGSIHIHIQGTIRALTCTKRTSQANQLQGRNQIQELLNEAKVITMHHDVWSICNKTVLILWLQNADSKTPCYEVFCDVKLNHLCQWTDNKVRELATVCLLRQQWTETSVWFDDDYYLEVLKRLREKVKMETTHGFCIMTMHLLTRHCL
jgi:hypothetical protein